MQVAVVGLGRMGSALAARLLERGATVTVWNRTGAAAERLVALGVYAVGDLASVWRGADAVLSFLADDRAVEEVCLAPNGLLSQAPDRAVLIEMSTISPQVSNLVAGEADRRGVGYLRSPVSGNPGVLAAGNATLIVSGGRTTFERGRPILELIGSNVVYVGEREQARVLKLAVNAMVAATAQMLAEVITLCEACEVERSTVLEVVSRSVVGSSFVGYKAPALMERQYQATFTTAMLLKDLKLLAGVAEPLGVPLPVTELVAELTTVVCQKGWGDLDFIALLPHLQHLAGRQPDLPMM